MTITLNSATLTVTEKVDCPEKLRMTIEIEIRAKATHPVTKEVVEIVGVPGNPFMFILRGAVRYGEIDFSSMIQEALTHIMETPGK